jgi:osmoprotectant transport system ATP-binding protein
MIELRAVSKTYPNGHVALRQVSLRVEAGTTLALLGPSGCGKTTTLKLINRLVTPTAGVVVIDGVNVADIEPTTMRRGIGYVVQDAGLFPHLTARANVEIVPQLLGWDAERRERRSRELFALVGLDYERFAATYPSQLSGGQRQRIGLARALAAEPAIVLLDEPFGALDPLNRRRLQDEFLALKTRLRKTMVMVTHDVDEALRLADHIAVFDQGQVLQTGTPAEVKAAPASAFVSAFLATPPAPSTDHE